MLDFNFFLYEWFHVHFMGHEYNLVHSSLKRPQFFYYLETFFAILETFLLAIFEIDLLVIYSFTLTNFFVSILVIFIFPFE